MWKAEQGSKTRQGDGHYRAFNPKAYATENEHCPELLYLKFASHRPEEIKRPEAPFFLAIKHKRKPADPMWYSRAPLEKKNKIGDFLTKAGKNTGLPGNVTNHSVRKTCISGLMDAEVTVNYVAQLSGHRNLKSLDSYKTASDDHQQKMSLLLSSGTKYPISSNDAPLNQAVKALSIHSSREETNKLLQERIPSLFFLLVRTSVKLKAARSISLSIEPLAALVKARLGQSRKNATLSSQMTQTQINLNFLLESSFSQIQGCFKHVLSRLEK